MKQSKLPMTEHDSLYMRYHQTLETVMNFIESIYQNQTMKITGETRMNHAIKIAGMTEQIQCQDYLDYHLTWLTGLLSDVYSFSQESYELNVRDILAPLPDEESQRVLKYIEQVNYNPKIAKGQKYKQMLDRVADMHAIPCYIKLFELYVMVQHYKANRAHFSKPEYEGYLSYAYMFWYKCICKHIAIVKNINKEVKDTFVALEGELGGLASIRGKAKFLFDQ